jgi:hypothetical protein
MFPTCSHSVAKYSGTGFLAHSRHYFRVARDPPAIKGKAQLSGIETYASALTLARPDIQGTPLD